MRSAMAMAMAMAARRRRRRSEGLVDVLELVVRLAVAPALLSLRQLDLLSRQLLVRNQGQQMRDDVEPPAPLVVGLRDVPRCVIRIASGEHLVACPRII